MKAIILAGGAGDRLWPLSRKNAPKQFLNLNQDNSLFQETIIRNIPFCDEFVIVTPGTTEEKMRGKTREIKDAMQKESFSFAIGYAVSDHRGIQQAAIRADQRMYQDKREYYQNHPRYR